MGGLTGGVFPQSHLPITLAAQLNGTSRHPERLAEDRFLDKMLNSGSSSAIFPGHLNTSVFGWEADTRVREIHTITLIILHFFSLGASTGIRR